MSEIVKKRKASNPPGGGLTQLDFGGIDLEIATPDEIADYVVSMIPVCKSERATDKLVAALDIVRQKVHVRDNRNHAEKIYTDSPVSLSGVVLPKEAMHQILKYVPQCDLSNIVALTSKALLVATREPRLWTRIDKQTQVCKPPRFDWWKFYAKPQFSLLTSLPFHPDLSDEARLQTPFYTRAYDLLALMLPKLEELDLTGTGQFLRNGEIYEVGGLFPNLKNVTIANHYEFPAIAIETLCKNLGSKLQKLTIVTEEDDHEDRYVNDDTLREVARSNSNLLEFVCDNTDSLIWIGISNTGIQALMRGCPALQKLAIFGTTFVTMEAFEFVGNSDGLGSKLTHLLARVDAMPTDLSRRTAINDRLQNSIQRCHLTKEFYEPVNDTERLNKRRWVW